MYDFRLLFAGAKHDSFETSGFTCRRWEGSARHIVQKGSPSSGNATIELIRDASLAKHYSDVRRLSF